MKTEVEVQIEQLLRKGERWNLIAQTLHVSKTTILKVSRRLNEETSTISATEVFTMFDEGKSPMEIVKEYNANPITITDWFKAWLYLNDKWRAYKQAEESMKRESMKRESMAQAQGKGGEQAEKGEKKPPFVKESKDWEKFLEREGYS